MYEFNQYERPDEAPYMQPEDLMPGTQPVQGTAPLFGPGVPNPSMGSPWMGGPFASPENQPFGTVPGGPFMSPENQPFGTVPGGPFMPPGNLPFGMAPGGPFMPPGNLPFGMAPGGQFAPPFNLPQGGFGGGGPSGPPQGPPPSFIPQQAQVAAPGVFAVDPGAIRPCRFRFVYIWLRNGENFWAWIVFVGPRSVAGWRWTGFRWVYFGLDLNRIASFTCY